MPILFAFVKYSQMLSVLSDKGFLDLLQRVTKTLRLLNARGQTKPFQKKKQQLLNSLIRNVFAISLLDRHVVKYNLYDFIKF